MAVVSELKRVPAPAKLNLFLHVVGQRSDGYHLLQSVFVLLDLYDYLDFTVRTDGAIVRQGSTLEGLAAEDDLIIRAARLLQQHTGTALGVEIACEKHIPAGAGMGGGSSDAATTLIALNTLWNTGLNRQQLIDLGLQLGADVPFFIFGQNAFVEGIGEQLQPVAVPLYRYLLLKPEVFVSTGTIFTDPSLTRNTSPVIVKDFTAYEVSEAIDGSLNLFGVNTLEPVVRHHAKEMDELLHRLHNEKRHARMTGSGSVVYLAYSEKDAANRQSSKICSNISLQHWIVSGLSSHPLYNWVTD